LSGFRLYPSGYLCRLTPIVLGQISFKILGPDELGSSLPLFPLPVVFFGVLLGGDICSPCEKLGVYVGVRGWKKAEEYLGRRSSLSKFSRPVFFGLGTLFPDLPLDFSSPVGVYRSINSAQKTTPPNAARLSSVPDSVDGELQIGTVKPLSPRSHPIQLPFI